MFTLNSTVKEVKEDPAFAGFGRLLFPVDIDIPEDISLEQVSSPAYYLWYSEIHPEETVNILNRLRSDSLAGKQIFFPIWSEEEMQSDPARRDTGLFCFRGNPGERFAIVSAGGGFMYVGAMHDSFPQARALSHMEYNAFALIYRPDDPYTDLAQAIMYIIDHAEELEVNPEGYSLWGGSAGARMAASLGNAENLRRLTGREDIKQAAAVIMQYTGYDRVSAYDAPTYMCVGTRDGIAPCQIMAMRARALERMGIPAECHIYPGLHHGFGLGTGTVSEGWIDDAAAFWQKQVYRK